MAALDFPSSPTVGQKYPTTPVSGVPVYTWDGEKWTTSGGAIGSTGGADDPPPMDGISAAGSSTQWAREDHVHPTDTTRAPITSPTFLISAYAPTPTAGDASTSVATTAFVTTAVGAPSTPYVRYDAAQTLTSPQQAQARSNISVTSAAGANVIINGDFRINQDGYVSAAVLAAGAYGHDQWKAGASGGNYSFTQLKSSTQITIASGKSLIQPIEDANVVGGSYVLTWTGTAQARAGINTLTPAGAYAASPLSIAGQTAGTAMSVEFNNGTLGTVKLESGAVATPFIMRPYDQELLMCQRYLCYVEGTLRDSFTGATSAQNSVFWPCRMRATPTVSALAGGFTSNGSSGVNNPTVNGAAFLFSVGGPTADAYAIAIPVRADARL